ncbi:DNA primase [Marinobacterium lutimaris]|uniref:DNA primase n=1 Tax=Marinobacterium lutimaris TaxID=568106 RepID=A0A1H6B8Q7_9GAMM|nr:DNA primase [Marinobacterium lutimaris]SEG57000.1 DNA primase [Marinobacterium lutimaris]
MAGRIPQYFIDDLLARVNIVDVVDSRIKLKRAGKNYSALCPFHKEKSPSFSVSPDKQFYYCFGCGAGGNALGFVMEHDRLSFPEAVEELARLAGMEVPRENDRPADIAREKQIKSQFSVLEQANSFYQQQLRTSELREKAVSYLKNRGLTGQIAARFQIGYAPPGWDNLFSHLSSLENAQSQLERAGLLIHNEERGRYYDRFRDRIMFPIRDARGRTIGFGGRVLGDDKPKYLNSPETDTFHKGRELYGLYEARQMTRDLNQLLIVEGYMDVVSLSQHGITWSVATLGTATTEHHLERLFKIVPEVIFCFDGDNAGRKAAKRALDTTLPVIKDGQQARFLFLPDGEDPDTLVRQEGEAAFTQRVSEALPLSEFFFKALAEDADLSSMDGRARFSNQALPLIQSMQPSLLQQMMMDRICEITGLSLEQLNSVIDLHRATEPATRSEPKPRPAPREIQGYDDMPPMADEQDYIPTDYPDYHDEAPGYQESAPAAPTQRSRPRTGGSDRSVKINLVSSAISILLHHPELAPGQSEAAVLKGLQEPNVELLIELLEYLQQTPGASLGTLVVDWQENPQRQAYLMLLNEIAHMEPVLGNIDPSQLLSETMQRLLGRHSEARIDELMKKQRQAPLTTEEKQQLQSLLLSRTRPA